MFEYLAENPAAIRTVFFVAIGMVEFGLAMWSRQMALIAAGCVMAISCDISNLVVMCLSYHSVPLIVPAVDGMLATILAVFALKYRNLAAMAVFALFMVEEAVWVTFVYISEGWSIRLVATLNAIYLAQVLLIGATSVKSGMASRVTEGDGGARHSHWRRGRDREGMAARQ